MWIVEFYIGQGNVEFHGPFETQEDAEKHAEEQYNPDKRVHKLVPPEG